MIRYKIDNNVQPSAAVPRTVAAHTNTQVRQLDPLYEAINPEALDSLFEADSAPHVTFEYEEFTISLNADHIRLE